MYPLDTVLEPKRKCWIQVWTPAADLKQAWQAFLGRPFRGLHPELYQKPFEERVEDPYLRAAALASLKRAGEDQQALYDFSFSETNIRKRGPKKDDLGVAVLISPEDSDPDSAGTPARAFWELFQKSGGRTALLLVSEKEKFEVPAVLKTPEGPYVHLVIGVADDPMAVRQQVALKMLLNAHSTAVMAKLGRVVGNTMTNVSPSNLKLIGRATYLIQSHANDVLSRPGWVKLQGTRPAVSYGEANAVLFDSIAYLKAPVRPDGRGGPVHHQNPRIAAPETSPEPGRRAGHRPEDGAEQIFDHGDFAVKMRAMIPARSARTRL